MAPVRATIDAAKEISSMSVGAMLLSAVVTFLGATSAIYATGSLLFVPQKDFAEFRNHEITIHAQLKADVDRANAQAMLDIALIKQELSAIGLQIKTLLEDNRQYQQAMRSEVREIGLTVYQRLSPPQGKNR